MGIASRIHDTLEDWQAEWKVRLKGWMASWLAFGIEVFFDVLGKATAPKFKPLIDRLEESKEVPPELQPILDELKAPKGQAAAILLQSASGAIVGGALGSVIDALFLRFAYSMNAMLHPRLLNEAQLTALWMRGQIKPDELPKYLKMLGLDDSAILGLMQLAEVRLDPASVVTAWRRDPAKYEKLFKDLRDQGWDNDRIEALKFFTQEFPALRDVIGFYAHEVFEPDMVSKYGLEEETPPYEGTLFEKLGVPRDIAVDYWVDHWKHASFIQMVEMLHRGLLTGSKEVPTEPTGYDGWAKRDAQGEKEMFEWYRLVEIPPIWRNLLTAALWAIPTRVDVRRWWDMRTISEEELISIYHRQGYHGKDLENYVLWTKVYVAFPDLMARFKNGWITEEDVKSELTRLGMPAERIEEMLQTKIKPQKPAQIEEERKATATEVMKGVKKGIITEAEGIEMLGDLGYDAETAIYKLQVYGAVEAGSPEGYTEFKQLTQLYRRAIRQEAKIPPIELQEAEKAYIEAKADLERAKGEGIKEGKLAPYLQARDDAAYRYRQLLIKWKES